MVFLTHPPPPPMFGVKGLYPGALTAKATTGQEERAARGVFAACLVRVLFDQGPRC